MPNQPHLPHVPPLTLKERFSWRERRQRFFRVAEHRSIHQDAAWVAYLTTLLDRGVTPSPPPAWRAPLQKAWWKFLDDSGFLIAVPEEQRRSAMRREMEVLQKLVEEQGPLESMRLVQRALGEVLEHYDFANVVLGAAIAGGNIEVVRHFLDQKGVRLDVSTPRYQTPLLDVIKKIPDMSNRAEWLALMDELIARGAPVTTLARPGRTTPPDPCFAAAAAGHLPTLQALLAHEGANLATTEARGGVFHAAILYQGKPALKMVDYLLEQGAPLEAVSKDHSGQTPLLLAVEKKFTDIAAALLRGGADAAAVDEDSRTILHLMVTSWRLEDARPLLGMIPPALWQQRDVDGLSPADIVGGCVAASMRADVVEELQRWRAYLQTETLDRAIGAAPSCEAAPARRHRM